MENRDIEKTEELLKQSGKKKKTPLIIAVVIAALVIAGIGGFAAVKANKSKEVTKNLDQAEKYMKEGEYEQAVAAYTAAIDIDAKSVPAFEGRAGAYMKLKKPKEAAEDYIAVVKLDKDNEEAYRKGFDAAVNSGDEKLIEEIRKLIEDNGIDIDTDADPDAEKYGGMMEEYLAALKSGKDAEAKKTAGGMPQEIYTDRSSEKMTDEQKAAFLEKVKSYGGDLFGYYLTDFDNDGACDLIVNSRDNESPNGRSTVLTAFRYDGGSMTQIAIWNAWIFDLYAYPGHDGIVMSISEMGFLPITWGIYVIKAGENQYDEIVFRELSAQDPDQAAKEMILPGLRLDAHRGSDEDGAGEVDFSALE